jgi:hypothetical protein
MEEELAQLKKKIDEAWADLQGAKANGDKELILSARQTLNLLLEKEKSLMSTGNNSLLFLFLSLLFSYNLMYILIYFSFY